MQKRPLHPSGHPLREGLRTALLERGANSLLVKFRTEPRGHRLVSYRMIPKPAQAALPAELAGQLRQLMQRAVDLTLPGTVGRDGRRGRLTWRLDIDRMEVSY